LGSSLRPSATEGKPSEDCQKGKVSRHGRVTFVDCAMNRKKRRKHSPERLAQIDETKESWRGG